MDQGLARHSPSRHLLLERRSEKALSAHRQNLEKQHKLLQVQNSVQSQIDAFWYSMIFFFSLKEDLMNAQNCLHRKISFCLHRKIRFRNSTYLSERQGDNSNCWQMETEYKNELSAGQADPLRGWDRTTSHAGHVGHSSSQ